MTVILGIKPSMSRGIMKWGFHDPGACLVTEDGIIAMAEEERFTREKRSPNPSFPKQSIEYVLGEYNTDISEVDAIAIGRDQRRYLNNIKRNPRSIVPTSLASTYSTVQDLGGILAAYKGEHIKQVSEKLEEIFESEFTGEWYQIPHHRCHAASAMYCSKFEEEIVLTIDGAGEDDSTVLWDSDLNRIKQFPRTNSIGKFYSAGCNYLGFRGFRDAGKVMGLASYGKYREEFEQIFDEIVDVEVGSYDVSSIQKDEFSLLEEYFGPRRVYPDELTQRHKDFAYHLQLKTEEIVSKLVEHHITETGVQNISLAGGVAMNCKMNREIKNMDLVNDLFIQPAANDPGISLGAALEGYRLFTNEIPDIDFNNVYYGPKYSNEEIETILKSCDLEYEYFEDISSKVADLLAAGEVVGWFQGRMEFGARALGNRSIIANPASEEYRDKVNKKVKHRESWRPFAPSLLYEARKEYLMHGDEAPFMILLDSVPEEKQDEIPAVTHVDGTTRPQTVRKTVNKRYYEMIKEFQNRTGTPVVLNTSFNVAGEPIVESPEQAIADFYTTGLDALAIENYLITK
jgi:carbamoyltransferase